MEQSLRIVKSSKENQKAYRERTKSNRVKYEEEKQKDRERMKRVREKNKTLPKVEKERRLSLQRERMRKLRAKKRVFEINNDSSAYATKQALGKAIHRSERNLPLNLARMKEVINALYAKFDCDGVPPPKRMSETSEDEKLVVAFYQQQDISQATAVRKEYVIVRKDREKFQIQKRYLLYTIKEAHQIFRQDNPGINIGLSKFSSLRPANVVTIQDIPHETCLCKTHENMAFLLKEISRKVRGSFPGDHKRVVLTAVCNE